MSQSSERLNRFLQRWWEAQLDGVQYPTDWRHERGVEQLASELRRDVHFELSQSTFLHRRPDEEIAKVAVASLSPVPDADDTALIVAAVVRAGSGARKVRTTTGVGAVLTVTALVLRNLLRGR